MYVKLINVVSEVETLIQSQPEVIEEANRLTVMERIRNMGDGALARMAIRATAIGASLGVGGMAAEMAVNATPVAADTAPVAQITPQEKQTCIKDALVKPQVEKAEVLHVGKFTKEPTQSWYLSTRYPNQMPDYCKNIIARGNRAKAQAFHNGHWVDEGYWHNLKILPETSAGNWEDIGNVKQAYFPVCKARILVRTVATDLTTNSGPVWSPHASLATRQYPVSADILPHKPNACK